MLSPFGYKHVLVLVFLFSLPTKNQLDISIAMQLLPYLSISPFLFCSCIVILHEEQLLDRMCCLFMYVHIMSILRVNQSMC